jgi:hypothetical protein
MMDALFATVEQSTEEQNEVSKAQRRGERAGSTLYAHAGFEVVGRRIA